MRKTALFFLLAGILSVLWTGCGDAAESTDTQNPELPAASADPYPPGKVLPIVQADSFPGESFALYLPQNYSADKKWPVLLGFDSHARGALFVKKYKALADEFGYILAGSNTSQNGQMPEASLQIGAHLIDELNRRFSTDPDRISAAGFSGGARVASLIAIKNGGIATVLACGAGLPPGTDHIGTQFEFMAFVGDEDFNYWELMALDDILAASKMPNALEIFSAGHAWPEPEVFRKGFLWMKMGDMRFGRIEKDQAFIDKVLGIYNSRAEENLLPLERLRNRQQQKAFFTGILDTRDLEESLDHLVLLPEIADAVQAHKESEMTEIQMRQQYAMAIQKEPLEWWQNSAAGLWNKVKTAPSTLERKMTHRVLNYLSLSAYMSATNALTAGDIASAEDFIEIYRLVDPENPEHRYMAAKLATRKGQSDVAIAELRAAAKLGFSDEERLLNDPDFSYARTQDGFSEIVQEVTNNQE